MTCCWDVGDRDWNPHSWFKSYVCFFPLYLTVSRTQDFPFFTCYPRSSSVQAASLFPCSITHALLWNDVWGTQLHFGDPEDIWCS